MNIQYECECLDSPLFSSSWLFWQVRSCRWAGHECFASAAGRKVYTLSLGHLHHPLSPSADTEENKKNTTQQVI